MTNCSDYGIYTCSDFHAIVIVAVERTTMARCIRYHAIQVFSQGVTLMATTRSNQDNALPKILPSEAARILGVSAGTVRWLVDTGKLPADRSSTGVRVLDRATVEHLAAERAARRAAK